MFSKKDVITLDTKTLFQGFYRLKQLTLKHKLYAREGNVTDSQEYSNDVVREVVNNHPAVGVLLVDLEARTIALVEQFRIGAYVAGDENPWLLEVVAGHVEAGETPSDVAMREAQEEAACDIQRLEHINDYYSSPGGATQKFSLFCGFCDLSKAGGVYGLAEEDEDILVRVLSFDEAFELLDTQSISNAHTIIAIQWLKLNHA